MLSSMQWTWLVPLEFMPVSKETTKTGPLDLLPRCDPGFSGDFCQISNLTLLNRGVFLQDNHTELMAHQGRPSIGETFLLSILYC